MTPSETESLLLSHNVKPTPQRMVIAAYLNDCRDHPTADEIFEAVADRLPVRMSRATVYNTLNTLVENGVAKAVSLEPGKTRYDANRVEHHHFVDTRTGRIVDIPWERVSQLCESLGPEYCVRDYQITFYGEIQSKPPPA